MGVTEAAMSGWLAVAGGSGEERGGAYLVAEGAERVDWKRLGGHST